MMPVLATNMFLLCSIDTFFVYIQIDRLDKIISTKLKTGNFKSFNQCYKLYIYIYTDL